MTSTQAAFVAIKTILFNRIICFEQQNVHVMPMLKIVSLVLDKYGLLTNLFGQDGWILAKFFFCVFTEPKSRSINMQKKNEDNIQPS